MMLRREYEVLFNDKWDSLNQSNIDLAINIYILWNNKDCYFTFYNIRVIRSVMSQKHKSHG